MTRQAIAIANAMRAELELAGYPPRTQDELLVCADVAMDRARPLYDALESLLDLYIDEQVIGDPYKTRQVIDARAALTNSSLRKTDKASATAAA